MRQSHARATASANWAAREHAAAPVLDAPLRHEPGRDGDGGGDVGVAVLSQREGGDALGVRAHFPSATMRSMAPRARAAMSGGTVMW